jgi:hypothetical protein
MGKEGAFFMGLYCFILCCVFPQIIMTAILTGHISLARNSPDLIVFSKMEQIKLDWAKDLISDVYAIDATENCNDQDEPAIE